MVNSDMEGLYITCETNGKRKGSLSGLTTRRPRSSAAEQCHARTGDSSIVMIASTALFSLTSTKLHNFCFAVVNDCWAQILKGQSESFSI